jgi:hypothetical protein
VAQLQRRFNFFAEAVSDLVPAARNYKNSPTNESTYLVQSAALINQRAGQLAAAWAA